MSELMDIQMDILDDCSTLEQPLRLVDSAAIAVAKHYSSSELSVRRHSLRENLLRKVAYWSFPQDVQQVRALASVTDKQINWKRGVKLVRDEKIREMWQVGFVATAYFVSNCSGESKLNNEIRVTLMVERQKIVRSSCSECKTGIWCGHIIAAVIYRIEYPDKVILHAPISEICLSLDRDQLQKLVQYAVNDDPVMLGKVFKHFTEIRNTRHEENSLERVPDPTCDGLRAGDKSQWDLSLDKFGSSILNDLNLLIHARSLYNYCLRSFLHLSSIYNQRGCLRYLKECSKYYPESYDITMKMKSQVFSHIKPVLEFMRQEDCFSAAELLQKIIYFTAQKMATTARSDCINLSHLWNDLSRIHSLLVLRISDKAARNILLNTANKINVTTIMREYIPQMSDWADLPSLCKLFSADDTEKLKTEGHMLIESVCASKLQSYPDSLRKLLNGTDCIENTSYDEDLIIMLARLESVFYFEEDCHQKIIRLGFVILQKLAIQARKYSVMGLLNGLQKNVSDSADSSSPVKLCPSPSGSSLPAEPECVSSATQPMSTASSKRLKPARGPSKGKHPAKRFKSDVQIEDQELSHGFVWSSRQIAYAMLYTLRMMIESQKVTGLESSQHRKLVGFCLQALELSRHRAQATVTSSDQNTAASPDEASTSQSEKLVISQPELDWLCVLEATVCDYVGLPENDECYEAVSRYIECMYSVGLSFYSGASGSNDANNNNNSEGAYPLVLISLICQLCKKNDDLKKAKSEQLVKICSDILLGSENCLAYNSLLKEEVHGNSHSNSHIDLVPDSVNKYHLIIQTFLSLIETSTSKEVNLLVMVLKQLKRIRNVTLLKLIGKDLRLHVWRYKDDPRVVKSMIKITISEILAITESRSSFAATRTTKTQLVELRYFDTIEKEFILLLIKKLDMSALKMLSQVWKEIFTCKELQDLVICMDMRFNKGNQSKKAEGNLAPELVTIIDEFYTAKLPHDEQACSLLGRFLTPGSDLYQGIKKKIIDNFKNYDAGALFHLAKLQLLTSANVKQTYSSPEEIPIIENSLSVSPSDQNEAVKASSQDDDVWKVVASMNQETFDIVKKAFVRLESSTATSSILKAVEWVFDSLFMCGTKQQGKQHITRLPFYDEFILCVCRHAKFQPQIVFKVLERIETSCGGISRSYLAGHKSISDLDSALITASRNYFGNRFKECEHEEYAKIIEEMQRARVNCKKFLPDGDTKFDKEVVEKIGKSHKLHLKEVMKKKSVQVLDFMSVVGRSPYY